MAASAGGVEAITTIVEALPRDLPASVLVLLHRTPHRVSHLEEILARRSRLPVVGAEEGGALAPGVVYVVRPELHLTITPDKRFKYVDGTRIRFVASSANPLLESAARAFHGRLLAVVLTGFGSDATDGVQTVKACGGLVIAQDQKTSEAWGMPGAAVRSGAVDYVLPLSSIGPAIESIVSGEAMASSSGT